MDKILTHIKECFKESASIIICGGIGILLHALISNTGPDDYVYGWYMWSCGSLITSSQFIRNRKKEIDE